jgi:aminopeptidase N/puromycin-sensitive aminopeptidase
VAASGSFCDASKADEVKQFFTTHKVASSDRTLRQTLERIHTCADLRSLQEANLANWLAH